jgi:protein SCO1
MSRGFKNLLRFTPLRLTLALAAVWLGARANFAEAQDAASNQVGAAGLPAQFKDVGVTEHLNAQVPLDLTFFDDKGQHISIGQICTGDKPVILQLGYMQCPMLCDVISKGIVESTKDMDLKIGTDYAFAFVSIDPSETPDLAGLKRKAYADEYKSTNAFAGIHIMVGQEKQIHKLADTVGFGYAPGANGQWGHPAVIMILTPDGRVSRYLYGDSFSPQTMRLSLVEASQGKIGTTIDKVLLFCLSYDSTTGKYTATAYKIMRLAGIATMLTLGSAIFWLSKISKHANEVVIEPENSPGFARESEENDKTP